MRLNAGFRIRVIPSVLFLLSLFGIVATGWLYATYRFGPVWANPAGLLVGAIGALIIGWALGLFQKFGNPLLLSQEQPLELITTGPYRLSRNPMYLGMAIVLVGVSVAYWNTLGAIFIGYFVSFIHYRFILKEEEFLEKFFGDEYRTYQAKVHRWI